MMALREGLPGTIYRKDYKVPDFSVKKVDLLVQIAEGQTQVTATLAVSRQAGQDSALTLDGEQLDLLWIELDGQRLSPEEYDVSEGQLMIPSVPDEFSLRTCVAICPEENTSLEGFYLSLIHI